MDQSGNATEIFENVSPEDATLRAVIKASSEEWNRQSDSILNRDIDHPPHYTFGKFEVIDVIEDWNLGYHLGNAIKYLARAGRKSPDPRADLRKAQWYIQRKLDKLEGKGK